MLSRESGLKIENLSFAYGKKPVLTDISFHVQDGCFCALLGPNGAGKSTIFALLTGLVTAERGRIQVAGEDLALRPRKALARMGIVFQEQTLDLDLSVRQNLSYYAALRGMSGNEAERAIDAVMDMFDLSDRAGQRARTLNGGHRRRTELARAMLHSPELLLLDEPTAGLDPASRASITNHVHDLCEGGSLTVLWATHLVDEIRPDDDLIILHKGQILAHNTASVVAREGTLADVFLKMTEDTE